MTLRVTFLGTAAAVPTVDRNPSAIHVNREGDHFLFDVGEGTQRQMMRFSTGFAISDIFLTHLHGDHVYGLPGLLETWEFNDRTAPLRIHTPPRTRSDLASLITVCVGDPSFPVRINEVGSGDTALRTDEYEVTVFETDHRTTSVGYRLRESDRKGRFNRERAEELGIPVGPKFSQLHAGEPVELTDGRIIEPEEVVGSPRPGRSVIYTGDTRPTEAVVGASNAADVLIHDGTFADEHHARAVKTGHSTAREAGEIADQAAVSHLVLTHISSRYSSDVSVLGEEASEVFGGEITVAADGVEIDVPFPEE